MLFFVLISIIIVLIVILILFLFVPFYLDFEYTKDAVIDKTDIRIKYFGITFTLLPKKKKKNQKNKKSDNKKVKKEFSLKTFKQTFQSKVDIFNESKTDIINILDYLSQNAINFELIKFDLKFGFNDAMATGVMLGAINGVVYNILSIIHNHTFIKDWEININPDFDVMKFDTHIRCILKIKSVHIIIIAIKTLKIYFKFKKKK